MSSRPERASGFTLVEVMVATLVLSLTAMGMAKLVVGHHKVLEGIDDWADGEPTFYLDPSDDAMERALGVPAALVDSLPNSNEGGRKNYPFDVLILSTSSEWEPPKMVGLFEQVAAEPKKKGKDDDDEDEEEEDDDDDKKGGKGKKGGKEDD